MSVWSERVRKIDEHIRKATEIMDEADRQRATVKDRDFTVSKTEWDRQQCDISVTFGPIQPWNIKPFAALNMLLGHAVVLEIPDDFFDKAAKGEDTEIVLKVVA